MGRKSGRKSRKHTSTNSWQRKIKGVLLFISLFYLTVYIPLILITYLPYWYQLNCEWHPRCEQIGYERALKSIDELTAFFRYQGQLTKPWTSKERLHLAEVRHIFNKLFFGAVIAVVILGLVFDRQRASRYALINVVIIVSLLLILPFFTPFWRQIFHPLLFDNELWKNNKFDVSYYIMPRQFFMFSTAFLIVLSCLLNLSVWLGLRNRRNS